MKRSHKATYVVTYDDKTDTVFLRVAHPSGSQVTYDRAALVLSLNETKVTVLENFLQAMFTETETKLKAALVAQQAVLDSPDAP